MDVHGRFFLIPSFVISFLLCACSKLVQPLENRPTPIALVRLISDGTVLVLHFIYLLSSRDPNLGKHWTVRRTVISSCCSFSVKPNDSYQHLLDILGSSMANLYAHVLFLSSVVGNHYMLVCAADIILEYLAVSLQQQYIRVDPSWRRWVALMANCVLTGLNCWNVQWTTATFAIYMKSLFMSFWMAKIWLNLPTIRATFYENREDIALLLCLTLTLLLLLVATKEFRCFPQDVVSANQTVLLPLYEHLVGIKSPELPIIVACYYAGSLNNFFLSVEPFSKAALSGQLPFSLTLYSDLLWSPIVLLLCKGFIAIICVGYLEDDLELLGSTWNCLLLISALIFDVALLRDNFLSLKCSNGSQMQFMAVVMLHVGFQVANIGWIFHRLTGFGEIAKTLLFIGAVTIVIFRLVQSEPFVEFCCNKLKLECCGKLWVPTARTEPRSEKDCAMESLA